MTCRTCKPWAAASLRQWQNRQRNMQDAPDAKPHVCPACGGTDWALTMDHIEEPIVSAAARKTFLEGLAIAMLCVVIAFVVAVLVFGRHAHG